MWPASLGDGIESQDVLLSQVLQGAEPPHLLPRRGQAGVPKVQGDDGPLGSLRGRGLPDVESQHLQKDVTEPQQVPHRQGQQREVYFEGQLC